MSWKDDERSRAPARVTHEPPADVGRRPGTDARPASQTVRAIDEGSRGHEPHGYVRGEEVIITDGMLGGDNLESGPERANPEGSVDIPNGDYREGR